MILWHDLLPLPPLLVSPIQVMSRISSDLTPDPFSHPQEVLHAGRLSGRECVRLMYVVGSLLRFVNDHEERLKVMDDIIRPFIQEFKRLLDEEDTVSVLGRSKYKEPDIYNELIV